MRNMRGALWALGLAGAAYAWRNRGKLGQQMGSLRGPNQGQLPDFQSQNRSQTQPQSSSRDASDTRTRSAGGNGYSGSDV